MTANTVFEWREIPPEATESATSFRLTVTSVSLTVVS